MWKSLLEIRRSVGPFGGGSKDDSPSPKEQFPGNVMGSENNNCLDIKQKGLCKQEISLSQIKTSSSRSNRPISGQNIHPVIAPLIVPVALTLHYARFFESVKRKVVLWNNKYLFVSFYNSYLFFKVLKEIKIFGKLNLDRTNLEN